MARHAEVKDVIRRARIETRVPPHLGIQTIFLFFLSFDHLLDQTLDLGIFDPFGLIGKILGVFMSFDIMAVWLAFKDNGSFFEEQLLPVVELDGMDFVLFTNADTGTPSIKCSLTIAIFCAGVKNLRFDIAVLPFRKAAKL
jgi:hypothetical protein